LRIAVVAVCSEERVVFLFRLGGEDEGIGCEAMGDGIEGRFYLAFGRDRPFRLGSIGPGGGAAGLGNWFRVEDFQRDIIFLDFRI
jgi:hypothetical protein